MSWLRQPWETDWDWLVGWEDDGEPVPSLWDELDDDDREAAERQRLEEE